MSLAEPANVLQLLTPPDGFQFHAGVWLSHDLSWPVLCDVVAPALTGVVTTGERRIQEARAAVAPDAPGLVVLHAADRFAAGPVMPWAHQFPVAGRRQHAKAVLLQYRSERGSRTKTRVLIGSGNLTRSGLNSNLEVIHWDERTRGSGEFLGVDVLDELRLLSEALPDDPHLNASLESLGAGLGAMKPTGLLVSSVVEQRAMLAPPERSETPAAVIDVVSPAFAGDSDVRAAKALAPWCGPNTEVRIHTGFDGTPATAAAGGGELRLSTGLLSGLRATGAAVSVHAVPEMDDNGASSGRLHAKLIALSKGDGTAVVFSGSANCTGPGLLGINREMMLRQAMRASQVRQLVTALESIVYPGDPQPPSERVAAAEIAELPRLTAVMKIDEASRADGTYLIGELTVSAEGPIGDTKVICNGQHIEVGVPTLVRLDPNQGCIAVVSGDVIQLLQIEVTAPESIEDFWGQLTPEQRFDQPDRDLQRLLGDIDSVAAATVPKPPRSRRTAVVDDGFTIPLSQRLVVLARGRRRLADHRTESMSRIVDEYLDGRTDDEIRNGVRAEEVAASARTAMAVHAAYDRTADRDADPLLTRLSEAIPAFDKQDRPNGKDR